MCLTRLPLHAAVFRWQSVQSPRFYQPNWLPSFESQQLHHPEVCRHSSDTHSLGYLVVAELQTRLGRSHGGRTCGTWLKSFLCVNDDADD